MADNNNDDNIDTATEISTGTQGSAKAEPPAPGNKRPALKLAIVLLALLIVVCAAIGWYAYRWHLELTELQSQVAALAHAPQKDTGSERFSMRLKALQSQLQQQERERQKNIATGELAARNAEQLTGLQQRFKTLSSTSNNNWKLAEAVFLLRLASQRVLLEHNSNEALALSQAADSILQRQNDPELFAVRQQLAKQMNALKMLEPVDVEGLYSHLQTLIEQVDKLPIVAAYDTKNHPEHNKSAPSPAPQGVWANIRTSIGSALSHLSRYIRVTHSDHPVAPLLPPKQRYFLRQNLRLMLEQAQMAVLREQPQVYRQSLQQAQAWLAHYYTPSAQAKTVAHELAELQKTPVKVDLPNVGEALRLLQAYTQRLHSTEEKDTP